MTKVLEPFPHDSIRGFYNDQNVFITGASGFVGKILVEKLLRSCPEVKGLFLLMRAKKGRSGKERIRDLTDSCLFDAMRAEKPEVFDKIHPILGDCMEKGLGISNEDFRRIETCTIVLHIAASVRFDDPLKVAILMNTRGTVEIFELALKLPTLKSIVHVSTTYCNPFDSKVYETVYPNKNDWKMYIRFAETLSQDVLDYLTPQLINFFPNTYTFTKKLAENVCMHYKADKGLPITIFRPSIITSSEVEPFPGFIDNFNGPVGLGLAGGTGIKRVVLGSLKNEIDFIPVDVCGKGILVAAWKVWKDRDIEKNMIVYNCANVKKMSLSAFIETGEHCRDQVHFKQCVWIPSTTVSQCRFMQYIRCILYQWLPAILIDTILYFKTGKPMLVKIHRKIYLADQALHYFMNKNYDFVNTNFMNLNKTLMECDRKGFFMTESIPNVAEYTTMAMIKAIHHLLKPTLEDARIGEKRYKLFKILDKIFKTSFKVYLIYFVWKKIQMYLI